jgi:hypothetical protein
MSTITDRSKDAYTAQPSFNLMSWIRANSTIAAVTGFVPLVLIGMRLFGWFNSVDVAILYDQTDSVNHVQADTNGKDNVLHAAQTEYSEDANNSNVQVWRLVQASSISVQENDISKFIQAKDHNDLPDISTAQMAEVSDYIQALSSLARSLQGSSSRHKKLVVIGDLLNYSSMHNWRPELMGPPVPRDTERHEFDGIDIVLAYPQSNLYDYEAITNRWKEFFEQRSVGAPCTLHLETW